MNPRDRQIHLAMKLGRVRDRKREGARSEKEPSDVQESRHRKDRSVYLCAVSFFASFVVRRKLVVSWCRCGELKPYSSHLELPTPNPTRPALRNRGIKKSPQPGKAAHGLKRVGGGLYE